MRETDLYTPIKAYLEAQGYEVKAEVRGCDVVAMRGDEAPVVVELKTSFSLALVLQGCERLGLTEHVYLAFPLPKGRGPSVWRDRRRAVIKLCRRLGLGLITVRAPETAGALVEVHVDPGPYAPRKNSRRAGLLLREFAARQGDPNCGGSTGRPLVTAYRQDALRCADYLAREGPSRPRDIRAATEVERAGVILSRDVYGWFARIDRGVYALTPVGSGALTDFADAVRAL